MGNREGTIPTSPRRIRTRSSRGRGRAKKPSAPTRAMCCWTIDTGWWPRVSTAATGTAERDAAHVLLTASTPLGSTVGGDKGFDVPSFVAGVRALGLRPHIAQKVKRSAVDRHTTRDAGYRVSQQKRKLI